MVAQNPPNCRNPKDSPPPPGHVKEINLLSDVFFIIFRFRVTTEESTSVNSRNDKLYITVVLLQ